MAKKGLHWLAWVGIGCGVLLVVGVLAMGGMAWFAGTKIKDAVNEISDNPVTFTAKAVALANPEIEFVSADEGTQEVVFRNIENDAEYRISFEDVKAGRIEFEGPEGTATVQADEAAGGFTVQTEEGTARFGGAASGSELPPWVPTPPGAEIDVQFLQSSGDQATGAFQVKGLSGADVVAFYKSSLEEAGYEVSSQDISGGGATLQTVTGRHSDGRQVSAVAQSDGIMVSFSGQ